MALATLLDFPFAPRGLDSLLEAVACSGHLSFLDVS